VRVKPELEAALENGVVAVTPNRRLARHLRSEFAVSAIRKGARAWPTPVAIPYSAWLESLWLDVIATGAIPDRERLLTPTQARHLWQQIVARDAQLRTPLIDAAEAAALAADAWGLLHAWGAGGESWRGWSRNTLSEDSAAFASWAEAYGARLAQTGSLDHAQLADALAQAAPRWLRGRRLDVLMVGFIELSPQQSRLSDAMRAAGARLESIDPLPAAAGQVLRATAPTPRDELAQALWWAREEALRRPDAFVGIALEDLTARLDEARSLAEDILCPALQWPGQEQEPRPFNISLGQQLNQVAMVSAALELLVLGQGPLPTERAAVALRSPYLVGASTMWTRRALLEARWLEEGRREIAISDAMRALDPLDPALAERWRHATAAYRLPASASPRIWTEAWRDWLEAIGWPGDRTLDSAEFQARRAWGELLLRFGELEAVEARLGKAEALPLLHSMAAETVFQPEGAQAPIQILGLLEAHGLAVDALWVAGLGAERWPPPPEPNALLPIEWQREHGVPRCSPARELFFARSLTERFRRAAPRVVFSHAAGADDYASAPSALIADLPELPREALARRATSAGRIYERRAPFELVLDATAPALAPGTELSGGAGLFEKQSDCPFRAVAVHRLHAKVWPRLVEGVSPIEHGSLVHDALAALWEGIADHDTLCALSDVELASRIEAAVTGAMTSSTVSKQRWRSMPPLAIDVERLRLVALLRHWLFDYERTRTPFRVLKREARFPLELEGLRVKLRLDRVDELAGGGVAIIDYKTGRAVSPRHWFDARPQAPQLGLYLLAWRAAHAADPVRAVVYAQLRRGEIEAAGIAADTRAWPALSEVSSLGDRTLADWQGIERRWSDLLGTLADEIVRGHAAVTPRDPKKICRTCGLQSLCRIGRAGLVEEDGGDEGE
jgi:ATP-dependent helicase/nuclease subunit B